MKQNLVMEYDRRQTLVPECETHVEADTRIQTR
jgi:hypothetical protein